MGVLEVLAVQPEGNSLAPVANIVNDAVERFDMVGVAGLAVAGIAIAVSLIRERKNG